MNEYLKKFLKRGMAFSGLGPVISGIVYFILEKTGTKIVLSGSDVLLAIITTYFIAFVHAGSTVFPQIDNWSKGKAMGIMFICLYSVYTLGYLINGWIPFNTIVFIIYTSCFVIGYLIIWLIAFLTARQMSKKLNMKLIDLNK